MKVGRHVTKHAKWIFLILGVLGVLAANPSRADAPAVDKGLHFNHAKHEPLLAAAKMDVHKCATCHGVDGNGQVLPPAALGHTPCMSAACHATYFLATGESGKKKDPTLYARAALFCQGCHDSTDGSPPPAWTKPSPTAALRSFQFEREYHVEMTHFDHTQKKIKDGAKERPIGCRDCHKVEEKTLALRTDAPGHAECVQCHNPKVKPDFTMAQCALCHDHPARSLHFAHPSRPKTAVRACGSEGQAQRDATNKHKKSVNCFKHETPNHRAHEDGSAVQCGECHPMVSQGAWHGFEYKTLKDLHVSPIIDNDKDLAHKSCGRSKACHAADVDLTHGNNECAGACLKCHENKCEDLFK
jgi:hypothetical protein